jgi:hypothetical protein
LQGIIFAERDMAKTGLKKAAKKVKRARKKTASKKAKSAPVNIQALRERVRTVVAEKLDDMTEAVADEAAKGHVAQLKYLFEVVGLYPAAEATSPAPEDSNDLAKKLLDSFQFPAPLPAEEEEDAQVAVTAGAGTDSVE